MNTPKSILEDELRWGRNLGTKLHFEEHVDIGGERFRVFGTFIKEVGFPPITGSGEGHGKENALQAASRAILRQMGFDFDSPNQSPAQSPGHAKPSNAF